MPPDDGSGRRAGGFFAESLKRLQSKKREYAHGNMPWSRTVEYSWAKGGTNVPVLAVIGVLNSHTPQQNSNGVLVGQFNSSGWDANMKMNLGQGGNFGIFSVSMAVVNLTLDNFELIDGVINDPDLKPALNGNI